MCNSLFNYTWTCGYGLHYLVAIFAEFDMDSLLLFPPPLRRSFRLVINLSVGSSGVKSAPGDHSCLSVECFLRLSLLLSTLYNKHCYLISPLFCSYMWELILKTHIWCASGFVLKTECYTDLIIARKSRANGKHRVNNDSLTKTYYYIWRPCPENLAFRICSGCM